MKQKQHQNQNRMRQILSIGVMATTLLFAFGSVEVPSAKLLTQTSNQLLQDLDTCDYANVSTYAHPAFLTSVSQQQFTVFCDLKHALGAEVRRHGAQIDIHGIQVGSRDPDTMTQTIEFAAGLTEYEVHLLDDQLIAFSFSGPSVLTFFNKKEAEKKSNVTL